MDIFLVYGEFSFDSLNTTGKAGAIILAISAAISLYAFIKVVIAAFAKKDPLLGVLCVVCQLWFILGWIQAGKWDVRKTMLLATLAIFGFVIGFALLFFGGAWGIVSEFWDWIKSPFSGS
ncbi:MAG: hypothetical protein ACI8UO_005240 [Verrucomicrobiales bacterium]|jgi:hypothetical protein